MTLFTLLLVLGWERLFKLGSTGNWITGWSLCFVAVSTFR